MGSKLQQGRAWERRLYGCFALAQLALSNERHVSSYLHLQQKVLQAACVLIASTMAKIGGRSLVAIFD